MSINVYCMNDSLPLTKLDKGIRSQSWLFNFVSIAHVEFFGEFFQIAEGEFPWIRLVADTKIAYAPFDDIADKRILAFHVFRNKRQPTEKRSGPIQWSILVLN